MFRIGEVFEHATCHGAVHDSRHYHHFSHRRCRAGSSRAAGDRMASVSRHNRMQPDIALARRAGSHAARSLNAGNDETA